MKQLSVIQLIQYARTSNSAYRKIGAKSFSNMKSLDVIKVNVKFIIKNLLFINLLLLFFSSYVMLPIW